MPRTPEQMAAQRRTQAAQIGISEDEFQGRQDALRTPAYNAAAYGGVGKSVSEGLLAHQRAGGTTADYVGDPRLAFLDRGGFGAGAMGSGRQTGNYIPNGAAQQRSAGLAGVAPGLQPPGHAGGAMPTAGMAPGGSRPMQPGGLAGVQPQQPRMTTTQRIRQQQAARGMGGARPGLGTSFGRR